MNAHWSQVTWITRCMKRFPYLAHPPKTDGLTVNELTTRFEMTYTRLQSISVIPVASLLGHYGLMPSVPNQQKGHNPMKDVKFPLVGDIYRRLKGADPKGIMASCTQTNDHIYSP
jgi:hypothetical protein